MSLLLDGAKTITIAGTEMQCIEIYTGEAYTLPFTFTDSNNTPINITGWTLGVTAKWYTCDVTYAGDTEIVISNLALDSPQPATPAALVAAATVPASGQGYIFLPTSLSGGVGSPPTPTPLVTDTTSILCIVTLSVSRTDPISSYTDVNREPIGLIIRYQ